MLIVPETSKIADSFYRLHYNFIQDRATKRKEVRREIQARDTLPTVDEVDRMMWSTRHHEYKFSEVTRSNLQQYINILNLYFSFSSFEFHCLMLNRLDPKAGLKRWDNDEWAAYVHFNKTLLEARLTRSAFAIVDLQGEPKKSDVHLEDVLSVFPIWAVSKLNGQPKRDGSIIVRSCKATQSPVYPIRDAILAVNHASCPSLSSSGPPPMG